MANYSPYDYNYGDFADYQMPETEEERQKRLAAEAAKRTPVKQVITTDPESGQQTMTISGDMRDLGPENPLTPTVFGASRGAGPAMPLGSQAAMPAGVDTNAVYNRMIQAESGNKQYGPNGQILTSPKGALGVAQIMPATALNPGYGVKPATMAEISTPEGNRAFGQRYFQGLLNYFGGDVQKATAAYNGGPGRVSRNTAANNGQLNVAQLPRETQQYLNAVRPTAVMPAAAPAAGNVVVQSPSMLIPPVGVAAPTETILSSAPAATETGVRPGAVLGQGGTATQEGTAGEVPAQQAITAEHDRFVAAQNKPAEMVALAQDPAAQPWVRNLARDQVIDNLAQAREKEKATREVEAARQDPNALAKMLQAKSSEQGSWAKAMLFSILGMEKSAADEAAKLGIGSKWSTVTDVNGKAALIKVRSDGVPLEGYDSSTGRQLSSNDLVTVMGAGNRKLDIVGGTYVNDTTGEVGRVVTDKNTGTSYIQTDTGRKGMAGFRPQGNAGTLDMQRVAQIQKQNIDLAGDWAKTQMRIQGAAPEAANKFIGEFNAKYGTNFSVQQLSGPPPQIDMTTGRMTVGAGPVAPAAAAAPAAAGTVSGAVAPTPIAAAAPAAAGVSGAAPLPGSPAAAGAVVPSGGGAAVVSTAGKTPGQILIDQETAKRNAEEARAARELALKEESEKRMAAERKRLEVEAAKEKQPIEVGTDEQKTFIKTLSDPKTGILAQGNVGREVADITRSQVNALITSPEIIGYLNGDDTKSAQFGKLIREVATGAYSSGDDAAQGKELADAMVRVNMPTSLRSKLEEIRQANTKINALTLRSNEGPGSISNFENKQNQANNMTNVGDLTPWSAFTGLSRRQFVGDLAQAKASFAQQHPELKTDREFNAAWDKEADKAMKKYEAIYQARLLAVKPYYDAANKTNSDPAAQKAYRDASVAAFRSFPVPEWNISTGKWEYKTKQARDAAMAAAAAGRI